MSTKLFNRLFHRGSKGIANAGKDFKVKRILNVNGSSYKVCIPPIVVEDLELYKGVILERKGDTLFIKGAEKD
jgi:hypothetical protein